jgi:tRNA (guanine37-N1)-methyltransferase
MSEPLAIDVITIFPSMLKGFLEESILKRASEKGAVKIRVLDLRDFTDDARRSTDDKPYGGGPGMLMLAEPLFKAVESVRTSDSRVILLTPQGVPFKQAAAEQLAECSHLIFICANYEGVDDRVREALVTDEISIGDYVLTNGVMPAAVVIDATVRLLPGVLGCDASKDDESFSNGGLEYPQYTRPVEFRGMTVPDVLLSGNHQLIADWRQKQAGKRTAERRPDLLDKAD